jgi:hypothetical protein
MVVLLVPLAIAFFIGLLVLADVVDRRSSSVFLVRSSLRSGLSCEDTEAVVAASLAPCLKAAGMGRDEVVPPVLEPPVVEDAPAPSA